MKPWLIPLFFSEIRGKRFFLPVKNKTGIAHQTGHFAGREQKVMDVLFPPEIFSDVQKRTGKNERFAPGITLFQDFHNGAGETLGYDDIAAQYYNRYQLPVMHTETSAQQGTTGEDAVNWLWKEWANALRVRNNGIPLVGFTWFPLVDQVDWSETGRIDTPAQDGLNIHPVGLYDLDRRIRPVGEAYRQLIREWRKLLPAQSVCLLMPVMLPSEYDEPFARRRRDMIHRYYTLRPSELPANPFGG